MRARPNPIHRLHGDGACASDQGLCLDAGGSLTKDTAASMAEGVAERAEVADLHELAARLDALTPRRPRVGVSPRRPA